MSCDRYGAKQGQMDNELSKLCFRFSKELNVSVFETWLDACKNQLHEVPQSLFSRGRIKISAVITPIVMEPQETRYINLLRFIQLTEKTKLNTRIAPE